jgi:hypothetical protein
MAPIWVMPPLWTHIKVPPYWGVTDAVGEVVAVGVALPQLLTNTPVRRINIRVKYIIFFISNSLLK